VVDGARVLLNGADIQPPAGAGPKPLGRGKRLRFRYPVNGIPGAPPPGRSPRPGDPEHRRLRHEFSVLSVRVFLATRDRGDAMSYHAYIAWRTPEDGWSAASRFVWSEVKPEALAANRRARRARRRRPAGRTRPRRRTQAHPR